MRVRPSHILLLLIGLLVSGVMLAVLIPKLGHLGIATPPASSPAATTSTATAGPSPTVLTPPSTARHGATAHHGSLTLGHVMLIVATSFALSVIAFAGWLTYIVRRRLANRLTREYGLYEIKLSMHDEAREQDLVDMVEALLHTVREFPEQRSRDGQPFVALEAHFGPGSTGELEWALCVRCERALVASIDGIVSAAYPDVRLGYELLGPPQEIGGVLKEPGHVLRFRKSRSVVYPIVSEVQPGAARPVEAIAQAQAVLGVPSTVRFQMTPCALPVERYARERLRAHEDRLAIGDGGILGSLNRSELTAAAASQDHAWCWLEVQVACESRETANRIAAAVLARRGENRLQRRWMVAREDLYRRRFPTAYPPLLPSPTLRTLTSSYEIAHLIALPGARLKNVPVRRLALPRIPAPPELGMAARDPHPELPPGVDPPDAGAPE
jgi:hypothetical protein